MSPPPRCAPRSRSSAAAVVVGLAALVVVPLMVMLASMSDGAALTLLAATAVGVITVVRARTDRQPVRPLPAPANPSGVSRAVPAGTAYWCAVTAPSCPRRPRAPGPG